MWSIGQNRDRVGDQQRAGLAFALVRVDADERPSIDLLLAEVVGVREPEPALAQRDRVEPISSSPNYINRPSRPGTFTDWLIYNPDLTTSAYCRYGIS